nr:auxin-responsive protein IAA9-like [Tanacetum cinerariifolium]
MSPPLLGAEGDGQGNGALLTERNYLGLSDCSSVDSTAVSGINLNLKATELRLGLPGSQSPERDPDSDNLDEKQLFPLLPSKDGICSGSQKNVVSGFKRGFADTIEGNWMFGSSGTDSDVQGKFTSNATSEETKKKNFLGQGSYGVQQFVSRPTYQGYNYVEVFNVEWKFANS